MQRMATLILVLVASLLGATNGGFLNGDCVLRYPNGKEVEYVEWLYDLFLHPAVPDTAPPGTEVARFTTRYIEQITSRQSTYIKPELKDGYLVLTTNEDFVHFEEWETEPDFKVNLDFKCTEGTARIAMWGLVEDSNNHVPEFAGTVPYDYTLPLPFPPAIPLSCVTGVVVAAFDIDLSTTRLDFQILETDALMVVGTWKLGRIFHANVTTTRYITAPFTATLRVTDNGEPPQSSTTKLSVAADTARSLPTLSLSSGAQ